MPIVDQYGTTIKFPSRSNSLNEIMQIMARENGLGGSSGDISSPFSQNGWVYSVITHIASALSEIPFGLWKPTGTNKNKRKNWIQVDGGPLGEKLAQPNPWQDGNKFIEQWIAMLLSGGNVWIYKDAPDSTGLPRALFLFGVDQISPVRETQRGKLQGWQINIGNNKKIQVPLEDMIHSSLPNPYDQVMGMAPWMPLVIAMSAEHARVLFDRYFFRNNATPDAVLMYKNGPLNTDARQAIYESWSEYHEGVEKAGGLAVIGGDFDIKVLGVNHAQAEYLISRKFHREEVASVYNFPVSLLNAQENSSLSKAELEYARIIKYEHAVFPHANKFAKAITSGLIRQIYPNVVGDFDYDSLPVMVDYVAKKIQVAKDMTEIGIPLNVAIDKVDLGIEEVEGGDCGLVKKQQFPLEMMEELAEAEITRMEDLSKETPLYQPKGAKKESPAEEDEGETDEEEKEDDKKGDIKPRQNLNDAILPIKDRCSKKLRRLLYNIRNECLRRLSHTDPFDKDAAWREFARTMIPVVIGCRQVKKDIAAGNTPWTMRGRDPALILRTLQLEAPVMVVEAKEGKFIGDIIARNGSIIDTIWDKVSRMPQMENNTKSEFEQIGLVSATLANQIIEESLV